MDDVAAMDKLQDGEQAVEEGSDFGFIEGACFGEFDLEIFSFNKLLD